MSSKTLIIYVNDSYYKYYELFQQHLYEINDKNVLTVYTRDHRTGDESVKAMFRTWEYFVIEEDSSE